MYDLIVLAMLADGPKHGYQLKREAGLVFGDEALHNNLIYPMLRRFSEDGWVTRKSAAGERGQTRHLYSITPLGRRSLLERIAEYSPQEAASKQSFMVRVGMFGMLDLKVRERILDARQIHLGTMKKRLMNLRQHMQLESYSAEVVRHLVADIDSDLSWIRRLRRLSKTQQPESQP